MCPPFFSWAIEQIGKDEQERSELILGVFDLIKPWLNPKLFAAVEKENKKHKEKIEKVTGSTPDKVEVINMYDEMMKRLGIQNSEK